MSKPVVFDVLLKWDLNFDEKVSFGASLWKDRSFAFDVFDFSTLKNELGKLFFAEVCWMVLLHKLVLDLSSIQFFATLPDASKNNAKVQNWLKK